MEHKVVDVRHATLQDLVQPAQPMPISAKPIAA